MATIASDRAYSDEWDKIGALILNGGPWDLVHVRANAFFQKVLEIEKPIQNDEETLTTTKESLDENV